MLKTFFEENTLNDDGRELKVQFKKGLYTLSKRYFIFGGDVERLISLFEGRSVLKDKIYTEFQSSVLLEINSAKELPSVKTRDILLVAYDSLVSSLFEKYKEYSEDEISTLMLCMPSELRLIKHQIKVNIEKGRKSGKIQLWNEEEDSLIDRRKIGCGLENCVFCHTPTSTWHIHTNNPVCLDCATIFKVEHIPEDWGQKIRKKMKNGTYSNSGTKAN